MTLTNSLVNKIKIFNEKKINAFYIIDVLCVYFYV